MEKKKINPLGILTAIGAAACLAGIITGHPQHFFGFLTLGGLSYALLTENTEEKPNHQS